MNLLLNQSWMHELHLTLPMRRLRIIVRFERQSQGVKWLLVEVADFKHLVSRLPSDFFVLDDVQMNFVSTVFKFTHLFYRLMDLVLQNIELDNLVRWMAEIDSWESHGQNCLPSIRRPILQVLISNFIIHNHPFLSLQIVQMIIQGMHLLKFFGIFFFLILILRSKFRNVVIVALRFCLDSSRGDRSEIVLAFGEVVL